MKLLCGGKENPIGMEQENLIFRFIVEKETDIQSFQIVIADSIENIEKKNYNIGLWKEDAFDGYQLHLEQVSFEKETGYYWQVLLDTKEGEVISEPAYFEMGIGEFHGQWITASKQSPQAKHFKKSFYMDGEAERARLYICGLGYFSGTVNGQRFDDSYYKPLVTDYTTRHHPDTVLLHDSTSHHLTYYTYDITGLLQKGENVLEVDVANGYYYNSDRLVCEKDYSFGPAQLAFEIHLDVGGEKQVIVSDTDTLVREQNYSSTLYVGDRADFTKEPGAYTNSVPGVQPDGILIAPQCEDDRVKDRLEPLAVRETGDGDLYDFGMNHTGGLEIEVEAEEGDILRIRYAEVLDKDGQPNYETSAWHDANLKTGGRQDIYQENQYILRAGINRISPLFSWFCYRYVMVEKPGTVTIRRIRSAFIHMDVKVNGHFACSDEGLTGINHMFLQTLYCNMHSGLVTDCPHREKRPYTGDGHLVMRSSYYNLDSLNFYYKWFQDLLDAQNPDGRIPNTAPDLAGGGGYAWGNALCVVTKQLYRFTGDVQVIRKGYPAVERWLQFYQAHCDKDYIVRANEHDWMLGDWLAPDIVTSNIYYINTVCYLMAVDTALWLAAVYRPEDVDKWTDLKGKITEGVNKVFFDKERLQYGNGVQGEDVLALATGIVPAAYEKALRDKVEHHYRMETGYHLDTGIVLTPILITYLTEHGYRDIAYRIMTAKTYPSYHTLMENDTTFSEHWSKKWPDFYYGDGEIRLVKGGGDLSHCHPMYGSVCSWLFERVAGLDLTQLHRKNVGIHPYFTDCLAWAKADKITPYGNVRVEWENAQDGLKLQVDIPQGLTADVCFPSVYTIMQNPDTEECYEAEPDGYFRFVLSEGTWILQTKGREQYI